MSDLLNSYKVAKFPVHLDIADKQVFIRPISHADMKPTLELIDGLKSKKRGEEGLTPQEAAQLLAAKEQIIDACIMPNSMGEKIYARNLHQADLVRLFHELKMITSGNRDNEIYFECVNENCEDKQKKRYSKKFIFQWEDCELRNKDYDETSVSFMNVDQEITFHLKPYTFDILLNNIEMFSMNKNTKLVDILDRFHASFIRSIDIGEKSYDNLSQKEIIEFLGKCSDSDLLPLMKYIGKQPMWVWEKEDWTCPHCGALNTAKIADIAGFFSI